MSSAPLLGQLGSIAGTMGSIAGTQLLTVTQGTQHAYANIGYGYNYYAGCGTAGQTMLSAQNVTYVYYYDQMVGNGQALSSFNYIGSSASAFSPQVEETPEQKAEMARKQKEWEEKEKVRRARARIALLSVLTDIQKKQLEDDKRFELEVNGRLYRITPGNRVERLDQATKKILSYFCIHAGYGYDLPAEDVSISQKLLLETNEREFLKIANETRVAA